MKLFLYALGSGAGHLIRGLAILRAIHQLGVLESADLVINSPYLNPVKKFFPSQVVIHQIQEIPIKQRRLAIRYLVRRLFEKQDYDAVLIDSFPYGIYQELPGLWKASNMISSLRWVYIFRRLLPPFEREIFSQLPGNLPYNTIIIPNSSNIRSFKHIPVEIRESCMKNVNFHWVGQIVADQSLFEDLKEFPDPLATCSPFICHTGASYEVRMLEKNVRKLELTEFQVKNASNFTFPLFERLKGAPWVCGSAGYNLTSELAASGKPSLLFPFPREFDDQVGRLKDYSDFYPYLIPLASPNAADRLMKCLENPPARPPRKDFTGATHLAELLVKITEKQ
ncbi:MAG: hypothetical protein ACFFD4_07040 [Candidatus Odinarchaeota archaeon]